MQEDLRIGDGDGSVPVDGDDRCALNVCAALPDERLLPVTLHHGHNGSRTFQPAHVRFEYATLLPEGSRLRAASGVDRWAPAVDQTHDGELIFQEAYSAFERGEACRNALLIYTRHWCRRP